MRSWPPATVRRPVRSTETVVKDPFPIIPLVEPPDCTIEVPGSKSITNRALITAGLAPGISCLDRFLVADDTEAMLGVLDAIGVIVELDAASERAVVHGCGAELLGTAATLDARQSGTTGRFATALAALGTTPLVIDGHPQLRSRPIGDLVNALVSLGVGVEQLGRPGRLPLRVTGPLQGGLVTMPAGVSSQFVSALMLAGAVHGLTLALTTDPVSRPYLDMTAVVMRSFGATVEGEGRAWSVGGGYAPVDHYLIEPDASAASYFLAAAAITGGRVRIEGLGATSMQGDLGFVEVLGRMGAEVTIADGHTEVVGDELHGIDVDMRHISDTAPTLAAVAAFADGPTTITGIGFVRAKESDRIAGPVAELRRCGVEAHAADDGFTIVPTGLPHAAVIETHEDHRMAMAFSLIGLMVPGIEIRDPGCVDKTFPGYFGALDQLR